ncbi:MAG: hypothetical protein ACQEQG_06735 [Bacillota bacterium]
MHIKEIKEILAADDIFIPDDSFADKKVKSACGADLMSDVLAYSQEKTLLLTGLTNPQVIRTAEMTDIELIIFVRGKTPPQETVRLAVEKNIMLLKSDYSMFHCCGLLYQAGIKPENIYQPGIYHG